MILYCTLSGMACSIPTFSSIAIHHEWQHPIFSLTTPQLLKLFPTWERGRLSKQESRLLALASFNATRLVSWSAPACTLPASLQIQESNIAQALPALKEILEFSISCPCFPQSQITQFPACTISSDNNTDLAIMVTMTELWIDCIAAYHKGYYAEYQQRRDAEKANFLSHLAAFSSNKPARYIKGLSRYVIDAIPASAWNDRQEREHMRYIIEYSGLQHTLETSPVSPITSAQCNQLLDTITDFLSLDNMHVWKAYQAVKTMLERGGHNSYGASIMHNEQEEQERHNWRLQAESELGAKPSGFIAAMAWEASILKRMAELATQAAEGNEHHTSDHKD